MKQIILISLLAVGFFSCEKYIEFDGEVTKSKIVLNSMITSDTIISVHLSNSLSVLDNGDLSEINNAVVAVYDNNGALIETLTEDSLGYYSGSLLTTINEEYKITAQALNFDDVNATTSIPQSVLISSWDTLTVPSSGGSYNSNQDENELQVSFSFTDNSQEVNYYMLTFTSIDSSFFSGEYSSSESFYSSDPKLGIGGKENWTQKAFFDDLLFNGETSTFTVNLRDIKYYSNKMEVNLYACSKEHYLYNKSYQTATESNGNPFAQPVQVYSNINNGLGIFGGYQLTKQLIIF